MIISCPACSTRYSIDPVPLGDGGKSVRCAKCGEKWHQTPELVAPQPQPEPQPEPESELESEAESPAQAAEDQVAEDQAAEPEAEEAAEPEAEEAPAEDKDLSQDDLDNLFDEAPAEEAPAEDEDAAAEDAEKEKSLSQNDLDDMFDQGSDKDEETPAPEKDEESGEESDAGAPDTVEVPKNLPDAELMPEVFMVGSSDDDEEEGARGGAGKIVGVIAAVLVLGLLAGAYFGRDRIVAVWPEAESFYAMLGASSPLGAGLDIRGVKWERTSERGKALLVIRGIIANVDDDPRPVPWIQITLYDASNDELRRMVFPPEKDQVAGGQSMNFKARVEEPPVTARRLEVTFTHAIDKVGG